MDQLKNTTTDTKSASRGSELWHKPTLSKLAVPVDTLDGGNIIDDAIAQS